MSRARPAVRLALAAAVLAGSCAGPDAEASPEAGVDASTVEAGVAVTLSIDRSSVGSGQAVGAIVTVRNLGSDSVRWRGGGCDLLDSVTVRAVGGPAGQGGAEGDAAVDAVDGDPDARLVDRFVRSVAGLQDDPDRGRTIATPGSGTGRACQIDHGFAELGPGERLVERVAWRAVTLAGAPLPAGRYEIVAAFPMLAADSRLVPAAFEAARDIAAVTVGIELEVLGGDPGLGAADALRALIDQTPLGGWVRAGSVDARDAMLSLDDRGWRLDVRLPTGVMAVGRIALHGGRGSMVVER